MSWAKASAGDRERLIRLLRRGEWNHLHFSSSLRERKNFKLLSGGVVFVIPRGKTDLKGALYITRGGALHACFEPEDLTNRDIKGLEKLISGRPFFSFIGRADRMALIDDLYGEKERFQVDYRLMVLSRNDIRNSSEPVTFKGVTFRRALKGDFPELYPLEKAYQKEEVLRNPDQLNEKFLKKKFLRQLSEEIIWLAEKKGTMVAKGGTNARGFDYSQIGGVFTRPEERGRGLARGLMNHLNRDLADQGWGSSLFVREDNPAARALYENCGYRDKGPFRIIYPGGNHG